MKSIAARYAVRSLMRHKRRTFLSSVGIGIGCAACIFLVSFVRGEGEMMMRAAAESGSGHLRIAPQAWLDTRDNDLRLSNWENTLDMARDAAHVVAAAPHARLGGLLAMGTRTSGVMMLGVDPDIEPELNRLVRHVHDGEYLEPGATGAVVIGKAVADRLDVSVGDDLMVTASGKDGEMQGAMLRVQGIVSTGSRDLDSTLCHVALADIESLTGYEGASEISILLDDADNMESVIQVLRPHLTDDQALITWKEIIPELAAAVRVDETFSRFMVGLVITVVFLGIASAQLAAVLERRTEFAVLSAIGMKGKQLVRIMLVEGLLLGFSGALLALAIGTPLVYWLSHYGIDFSAIYGDIDLSMSNILVDPIIYGDMGWFIPPMAFGLSLLATMLSSVYPAAYALRTDPATALRVEQ